MRIFILGAGKMGAWLTEELCLEHEVAVYDQDLKRLKFFFEVTRLSKLEQVRDFAPEMAINCASLRHTREAFDALLPHLPESCIIADIMSIKADIADYYAGTGRRFVSVHPMFGPTFANLHNLEQENAIIISESCEEGKAFFRELFTRLKLRLFELSFKEHDQTMAYSLSIPFASSMVFAACLHNMTAPGTTFRKHLAIAQGLLSEDEYLLAEIMFNPETIKQIETINNKLNYLCHIIKGRDYEEMAEFVKTLRGNIGS